MNLRCACMSAAIVLMCALSQNAQADETPAGAQPSASRQARLALFRAAADASRADARWDDALAHLGHALELTRGKHQRAELLTEIGEVQTENGQFVSAIDSLREALALRPRDERARVSLAAAYEISELFELARQEYDKILRRNPRSRAVMERLADLNTRLEFYARALPLYQQALQLSGASAQPELYRKTALCAEAAGQPSLAASLLSEYTARTPDYDALIRLGRINASQNKAATAEESFARARSLDPLRGEAYLYSGLLLMSQGRNDAADELFASAEERLPNNAFPPLMRAISLSRAGDTAGAETALARAAERSSSPEISGFIKRFNDFLKPPSAL